MPHHLLGYGALLDEDHVRKLCGAEHVLAFTTATLRGWRRHWDVRYRNGCWEGGAFHDAKTGRVQEGGVAFLGVRPDPQAQLLVSCVTVDDAGLAAVDAEEYLYAREDVTAAVRGVSVAPLWLYRERPELYPEGWFAGDDVVVNRGYLERVTRGARRLGDAEFEATTDPCPWHVVDLVWR